MRRFLSVSIALLALALPGMAWAQTGTITGTITDAGSMAPVSAAQVHIPELGVGTLTQANGRFLIVNVPTGAHTLRVERIGYRAVTREVTVSADAPVEVNVALAEDALALDEIVVTGTAGQARRREVGNQIAQVNVDDVLEPVTDVGALLQGRVAGARITAGSGNAGSAADIRLRGNVSVAMSNQPLIYIDGVRVRSEPYPVNTSGSGRGIGASADPPGPLSSLNPDDIERIEIVKGPAATTLYGTEAASGVIQIFTKRGSSAGGGTTWTAEVQQGMSYLRDFGPDDAPLLFLDPVLRNGHRQRYSISARGGAADRLGYFVSAAWGDNEGPVIVDGDKQWSLRANTQFQVNEDLLVQLNNSYSNTELSHAWYGNTTSGIMMNVNRGDYGYNPAGRSPETLRELLRGHNRQDISRFQTGVTFNYTPAANFTHRLTLGYDQSHSEGNQLRPYGWRESLGVSGYLGNIVRNSFQNTVRSIDYVGTLSFDVTDDLANSLAFGFQGVENDEEMIFATGSDFPGPGDYTIRSTARREGLQDALRVITGGFFLEDRIAFLDRYFVTLGLRVDGNSAFGQNLGLEPYPKVSLSYVLSDESFFPETSFIGETKLRAAYGMAGRAPGAFDAVRTWDPVGWGNELPAFQPANLGNPELGPERTTEMEVGFDATFLNDRLVADFTYYSQTTKDALFQVGRSATAGGWNSQLENVGELTNSGIELNLNANVLATSSFSWDVGLGASTNKSEVVSLGGTPEFSVGNGAWIIEGQPAPVIRTWQIANFWEQGEPEIVRDSILGPAFPTHMLNLNTALTLPGGIMVSARGEYSGGAYISNGLLSSALSRAVPHPVCFEAYRKMEPGWEIGPSGNERDHPTGSQDNLLAWERAQCFGLANGGLVTAPSDLFELRDVTLSVPISNLVPAVTGWASRTDLTVSARNLWFSVDDQLMLGHPDMNETRMNQPGGHEFVKSINEQIPPSSHFTISLRMVF